MFTVVNSPIFATLKTLDLNNSWNFDSDETCQHLADLIATAPKLEKVDLRSYRVMNYAQCLRDNYPHRAIRVELKYATESVPGQKKNGFVRIYKVHAKYARN